MSQVWLRCAGARRSCGAHFCPSCSACSVAGLTHGVRLAVWQLTSEPIVVVVWRASAVCVGIKESWFQPKQLGRASPLRDAVAYAGRVQQQCVSDALPHYDRDDA